MIAELLTGRRPPGVYTWPVDRKEAARGAAEAERAGRRVFWLDVHDVRDKRALLERCAEEFLLPSYFGHNWDALQDGLRDLSWAPANCGYLVMYDHWRELAGADPAVHQTLLEVFTAAVEHWRHTATPLAVLILVTEEDREGAPVGLPDA
ncbi:barstar family protein [Actinoallomurus sp. NPDC052308]|uniref:barstar family protein n=1 Tax=Actinoallomurus sp. NPDC052308 TaxID=3155530 RepID=UPI00341ABDB5